MLVVQHLLKKRLPSGTQGVLRPAFIFFPSPLLIVLNLKQLVSTSFLMVKNFFSSLKIVPPEIQTNEHNLFYTFVRGTSILTFEEAVYLMSCCVFNSFWKTERQMVTFKWQEPAIMERLRKSITSSTDLWCTPVIPLTSSTDSEKWCGFWHI